jgi:hypothetical protein
MPVAPDFRRDMIFRAAISSSIALLGLACLVPNQASAGLIGAGNTVQGFYYNGVLANPEGEIAVGAGTTDPASLAVPVNYTQGAADGSTIAVGDTRIAITNVLSGAPFCFANTPGNACVDAIDGFDFLFTGEDITGVSVSPLTAPDFAPVTGAFQGNTHLGLQLISPNEIRVDVTGDEPAFNDELVIEVSTGASAPSVPEPATLPFVGAALGLGVVTRRMFTRRA